MCLRVVLRNNRFVERNAQIRVDLYTKTLSRVTVNADMPKLAL